MAMAIANTPSLTNNECKSSGGIHLHYLSTDNSYINSKRVLNDYLAIPGANNCTPELLMELATYLSQGEPLPNNIYTSGIYKLPNAIRNYWSLA